MSRLFTDIKKGKNAVKAQVALSPGTYYIKCVSLSAGERGPANVPKAWLSAHTHSMAASDTTTSQGETPAGQSLVRTHLRALFPAVSQLLPSASHERRKCTPAFPSPVTPLGVGFLGPRLPFCFSTYLAPAVHVLEGTCLCWFHLETGFSGGSAAFLGLRPRTFSLLNREIQIKLRFSFLPQMKLFKAGIVAQWAM